MYRYRVAYSYTSNVTGKTETSVRKVEVPYSTLHQKAKDAIAETLRQSHFGPTVEGDGVVVLSACLGLSPDVKGLEWHAVVTESIPDSPAAEEKEDETVSPVEEQKLELTKEKVQFKKTPVKHVKKKSTPKRKSKSSGW